MDKEVEISNPIDKAIIESFKKAEKGILPRKAIIKIVKERIDKDDSVIAKRIEKLCKESYISLIKTKTGEKPNERKWGLYKLNDELNFGFIGEPLPSETKSPEISSEIRAEHTEDLKKAIKNWIENFPKVPYSENSLEFFGAVDKCEQYPLFKDLLNHLPESGYDICQQWEKFKNGVNEKDRKKTELLELIEKSISDVFKGLELKFVRRCNNLNDYECYLAFLIYDSILWSRIDIIKADRKYRCIKNQEEQDKYYHELDEYKTISDITEDRLRNMIVLEKGDSAIWGETKETFNPAYIEPCECIRVPKKDIDILRQGIDDAISIFTKSTPEIDKSIKGIIAVIEQLEKDRDYLTKQLNDSLFCKIFLGDCKYLGGRIR